MPSCCWSWVGVVVLVLTWSEFVCVRVVAEDPGCLCLTSDGGALDSYKFNGQLFYNDLEYPNDYGTGGCRAYDTVPTPLQPFCGNSTGGVLDDAPAWCFDQFCYVDPNNCSFHTTLAGVFPDSGLQYSYETCGTGSTFVDWFGVNGSSASSFRLDDLADVVENYISALRRDIEETYVEYGDITTFCDHSQTGCPCDDCPVTEGWGTGVDFDATMLKPHATTPLTARSSCLSQTMNTYFSKIAATEYHDTSKFANLYGGFQEDGALSMYPEFDWCPTDYDPRFRPWYSTAATNPKLIIMVIDVSASMASADRIALARSAALAVLDTLTWNDDIGFILFNNGVRDTHSITACNDENRAEMKLWVQNNIIQSGATNFILPLEAAFDMIEQSSSTACTKAILFLTDGVAEFTEDNFIFVEENAELNSVVVFTYALGSDADTTVTHRLACDNHGIFYNVADGADLSEVMSSYYSYFAASISFTGARWILYNDFATGTELLSACTPMYDTSDSTTEIAKLIGVLCMDMNMIVDVVRLRNHSQWDDLYDRVLATSEQCSTSWSGISTQLKLTILEELREQNAGNGAEMCNNEEVISDGPGVATVPIMIIIIAICVLFGVVIVGAIYHKIHKIAVAPEKNDVLSENSDENSTHETQPQLQSIQPVVHIPVQQQPQPLQQPHFVNVPQQPPQQVVHVQSIAPQPMNIQQIPQQQPQYVQTYYGQQPRQQYQQQQYQQPHNQPQQQYVQPQQQYVHPQQQYVHPQQYFPSQQQQQQYVQHP